MRLDLVVCRLLANAGLQRKQDPLTQNTIHAHWPKYGLGIAVVTVTISAAALGFTISQNNANTEELRKSREAQERLIDELRQAREIQKYKIDLKEWENTPKPWFGKKPDKPKNPFEPK